MVATYVSSRGKQTNLVNVYYPNGSNSEADVEWLYNLETNQNSWVVAGDFNVSHKLWDTGQTKDSGDHLANTILNSRLVVLNDGSFTRIGQPGQRSSAIDLTLTSPDLSLDAEWTIGTDHLQSDHLPLHLVLHKADPTPAEIDTSPKFLYHKADWELLALKLTSECENHDPRDPDINTHYENIGSMILRAAEATIPKNSPGTNGPHQHSAAWWNEECAKSTRAKRWALRHFQKNLSESNKMALSEATKHCEATTEDARKDHWVRFCKEEINGPEDSSKMWRKIRQMRKQRRRPERPLLVNGQLTKTSQEKADALANTFSKASQSNHLPPEMKEKRRNAESTFSTPQDNSTSFNSNLTLDEVRTAVASLGTNSKATGTDPISYHMIRTFPEPALRMLHTFFQTCWTTGNIPKDWKKATVVAISKNGKPPQQTSSYRPIALTPHLGKVYERVLKNRLDHHLEKNEILPLCQAGFRNGRNCMEHVVRRIEDTKKWSLKGKNKKTVATIFDIKKAFDSVWYAKLLNKMGALGITGRMYNFIQTFLDSIEITVKVGPSVSRSHILDMGVPQGSIIAPTLFSIMLHDILTTLQPQNKPPTISLFADDLAIWSHISDHAKMHKFKLTYKEQLAEKQRQAEEKRERLLQKRASASTKSSKRRQELMKAKEFEAQQQLQQEKALDDHQRQVEVKREARLKEIQEKQRIREERAKRARERAKKLNQGDNADDIDVEKDDHFNASDGKQGDFAFVHVLCLCTPSASQ
ncbi:hypothetical protein ACOMHN_035151 [Nucella lapillus]